ncbi:MAG TPA: PAS domain-containing protein [Burkholderiaceae bacterium]|nr:PAS domain-containing protein [Burkholderiaceae bacterium]
MSAVQVSSRQSSFLPPLLDGGGEMGARLRAFDWNGSVLGSPAQWPAGLSAVVRLVLESRFPMWLFWGPQFTFFCNDACAATLGSKSEWAIGASAREVWAETWSDIASRIDRVLSGGSATWDERMRLFLERGGQREETYHTFSYSPLRDDDGAIRGLLCVITDETERVIGERRAALLLDLAAEVSAARSEAEVFAAIRRCLEAENHDLPFTLTYRLDAATGEPELATHSGIAGKGRFGAIGDPASWPLADVFRTQLAELVDDLPRRAGAVPSGPWDRPPTQALVLPIVQAGRHSPVGAFVAALSPHRPLDAACRGFIDMLVGQIAAALQAARTRGVERRRSRQPAGPQHVKATLELRAETASVLETINEGFFALDDNYRFVYVNAAAERLLQSRRADLLGRSHREVFPDSLGERMRIELRRAMNDRVASTFETCQEPWRRWFEVSVYPMDEGGVGVYFRDVTDHKRAIEALHDADRRKDEFLALLAHELRNPLAPMRNALQLVRHPRIDAKGLADAHALMERQFFQLVRLVDDLLDVSRITQGKLALQKSRITLQAVLDNAAETARPAIEAGQHELRVDVPSEPVVLHADPLRLAQVFANLLTNSAKYTPRGGVIRVRAGLDDHSVLIRIEDNGIGIAPEALDRVFDMFSQTGRAQSRSSGGLGIGLALVKSLIEMHGGTVVASSDGPGRGSAFVIRLPRGVGGGEAPVSPMHADGSPASDGAAAALAPVGEPIEVPAVVPAAPAGGAAAAGAGTAEAGPAAVGSVGSVGAKPANAAPAATTPAACAAQPDDDVASSPPRRVLVVDDNVDTAASMATLLHAFGHHVQQAHDGEQALEMARRFRPEMVLMDIGMPRMNGLDATRRIRQLGPTPRPLIVAVTGWGQIADRERSYEAGCDLHLTKPVELDVLLKILKRLPNP